jgi:hypothetical protein
MPAGWRMAGIAAGAATAFLLARAGAAAAQSATCSRADFETTVEKSADVLREISQQNAPKFQSLLRQLKDKRGWSHEQFMREAEPFVRDDTTAEHDQKSEELLLAINTRGQDGGSGRPDCVILTELRTNMTSLVEVQRAKWAHVFGKITAALAK